MKNLLRAIYYFRPDMGWIVGLMALIGCSVVLGLLQAWPMAILVDTVLSAEPKSDWIRRLFLAPLPESRLGQLLGLAVIGMGLKICQDLVWMARQMVNARLKWRGTARVREILYNRLQALGVAWHKSSPQGDALYRMSTDTQGPFGVLDAFIGAAAASVTLIGMTAIMLSRNVSLTLFALSITPLLVLVNAHFKRTIRARADASKQAEADFTTAVQRALSAVGIIHAFNRQAREAARVERTVNGSADRSMSLAWQEYLYPFCIHVLFAIGGAVILGYGGYLVYRDQFLYPNPNGLTCGDMMVFMAYLGQLWEPLGYVLGFPAKVQPHAAACERVRQVLATPLPVSDVPFARRLTPQPRTLTLRNVRFAYPGGSMVLKGVNAEIRPGEMVAFVGSSGTGKSTLLGLLPRFYDPQSGSIHLDGLDIRNVRSADLRRHLALVSQDCGLFPASVAENIAFGRPSASRIEIERAAHQAGAAEFIELLPDGYDSLIAECASNLSGGQRQRLALARALLSDAPILVLDEPTSALDPVHEQHVLRALRQQRGRRTVVLVTHRLESVIDCDCIYVMRGGKIVERGTHERLAARNGTYARMLSAGSLPPAADLTPSAPLTNVVIDEESDKPL